MVYQWQTRDHLSVMTGLSRCGRLSVRVRPEALDGDACANFLTRLLRRSRQRWLVIWDGSPIHRGEPVRTLLANGAAKRLHVERLPAYAPELNPVEGIWQRLKQVELRNVVCLDVDHLREELRLAIARLRQKSDLAETLFHGAGLSL